MDTVRTRFAPSPTGRLHLGNARTALFNWAYARHHHGTLVLRVEDTDRARSTPEAETGLLEALDWLGIDWDEGPIRQSERRGRHEQVVEELVARGAAYRCVCSAEDLEQRKQATIEAGGKWTYDGRCRDADHGPDCGPHTVRLRLPQTGALAWDDLVFGPSGQDASEIGDRIIRRSDGTPLYHLAVVVDDMDMGIDTVVRGADHHANTPFQLALHEALGHPPPRFAHVPLILGEGGKKLSKREAGVAVEDYRAAGYLPDAVRNWIARLGWSHGDQELFSAEELIGLFDLDAVGRAAARAEPAKLRWFNQHYLKTLPRPQLFEELEPYLTEVAGGPVEVSPALEQLVDLLRERATTLPELAQAARFFLVDEVELDEKAAAKHLKATIREPLADLCRRLGGLEAWTEAAIESCFEATLGAHADLKMGKLAQPVRVAVTGSGASPGIFETLAVLGQKRSVERIERALGALPAA